ncbi:plasmid partitioning protein RepB [Rhizobium helianthi]|uniref:Plasmid partitioning protein RepB n=1 Tax=Rhizobium helianthi TaxID=1132695 RepID=A0ABW4M9C9_9HYPH
MSKSPRKSIVASFGLLSAQLGSEQSPQEPKQAEPVSAAQPRVGAGVIGAAHRAIDDIRSERDRLKALLESGGGLVREIDTALIDPSPFPDRLPDDDQSDFEAFKHSIEQEGQKVPIQVRKHPQQAGRYQVVYGHRRCEAARQLGRPVRALEVEVSDLDLVLAQGIENAARQDLTWIERALFAWRMDQAGIKPRDIYAALSIEDAELARMRNVCRSVPADILEAIGRAPKIGRPRWLELAKTLASDEAMPLKARQALAALPSGLRSDDRFQRLVAALKPDATPRPAQMVLGPENAKWAVVVAKPKELKIVADGERGMAFLRYLEAQMPQLTVDFEQHIKINKT